MKIIKTIEAGEWSNRPCASWKTTRIVRISSGQEFKLSSINQLELFRLTYYLL